MMIESGLSRMSRTHVLALQILVGASSSIACDCVAQTFKEPTMTSLSPRLQTLFEKTKSVCVGQFLIEVPATATVAYGPAEVEHPTWIFPNGASKVDDQIQRELKRVEEDRFVLKAENAKRLSMFGKVIDGALPGQKLVFGSKDHYRYTIVSIFPLGANLVVQEKGGSTPATKDRDVAAMNALAKQFRLRAEDEIPTEVGTCIEGSFVPRQPMLERVTVGIRLNEFPDVHFSVEVHKNLDYVVESSDLELLMKRAEKAAPQGAGSWYSRIKFFRRGPREIKHWKGYEALARLPEQESAMETHEFRFHSIGAVHDPLHPELDMQLDTGVLDNRKGATKPSITDEEAVALWDRLSNSIRVRPTRAAKPSAAAPTLAPLGELVASGRTCPQTGWWLCKEIGDMEGGHRQYFMQGVTMPKAILQGPPNLWQRLQGQRPTHPIDTVWQLLEYGPAAPMDSTEAIARKIDGIDNGET